LASPQYASVPEPVQNIENNRCQRPFLHWWWLPWYAKTIMYEISVMNLLEIRIFLHWNSLFSLV